MERTGSSDDFGAPLRPYLRPQLIKRDKLAVVSASSLITLIPSKGD